MTHAITLRQAPTCYATCWLGFTLPFAGTGTPVRRWSELGFQGRDPTTDFRGTGMLGLRVRLTARYRASTRLITEPAGVPRLCQRAPTRGAPTTYTRKFVL
jgi:hypothetical protein